MCARTMPLIAGAESVLNILRISCSAMVVPRCSCPPSCYPTQVSAAPVCRGSSPVTTNLRGDLVGSWGSSCWCLGVHQAQGARRGGDMGASGSKAEPPVTFDKDGKQLGRCAFAPVGGQSCWACSGAERRRGARAVARLWPGNARPCARGTPPHRRTRRCECVRARAQEARACRHHGSVQ